MAGHGRWLWCRRHRWQATAAGSWRGWCYRHEQCPACGSRRAWAWFDARAYLTYIKDKRGDPRRD